MSSIADLRSVLPVTYVVRKEPLRFATVRESPPPGTGKPRFLDTVRGALRTRHYSRRTEEAYVAWIRRYILFHGKRHPVDMGAAEVSRFLTWLAVERHVAASTQNQTLGALLFLYRFVLGTEMPWLDDLVRARRPEHLPVVLTRDEVRLVLESLAGTPRLMAFLLYGAGLRLLECCRLRVQDVDFGANHIVVRSGKGDKDRVTMLPGAVRLELARHLERVRAQHRRDVERGAGWVELPSALDRKYPNSGREWPWQWVFPATRIYVEPATGQRRRHHLHESVLQRAVKEAVLRAGLSKRAGPYASPFVRHASPGERARHPHRPGTPRPPRRVDDDDLYSRPQPGPCRCPEPHGHHARRLDGEWSAWRARGIGRSAWREGTPPAVGV